MDIVTFALPCYDGLMVDLRFANSMQIMLSLANAKESGELISSAQLAVGLKANPAFVRKLLAPLVQAKLIHTFKGKTGGAELARQPKQINLRQIYEAAVDSELVNGPEKFNTGCPVGSCMNKVFHQVTNGMEEASLGYLETVTLDKLLAQVKG
jgi:Rrf2 family transcriptional repressor of oqxAB